MNTVPAESGDASQTRHFIRLSIRIGALLGLYMIFEWCLMRVAQLPQASYKQPFIFVELGKHIGGLQLLLLVAVVFTISRYRSLWHGWSSFDYGKHLRWLIILIASIMAWASWPPQSTVNLI
ncbi:MAG: hypothetical protein O7E52_28440 [Candidatus Poribacteria bacterium]|nr:hypothetical protein [Candidatus Poribacteria bacterium]